MPISPHNRLNLANQYNKQEQFLPCQTSSLQTVKLQKTTVDNARLIKATHILVAIGSNYQANAHIPFAKTALIKLSKPVKQQEQYNINFSTEYTNPDYTASSKYPKPDYTNLCAEIELLSPMTVADVIDILKSIENSCLRHQYTVKNNGENIAKKNAKNLVTLDLDLLAVIMEGDDAFDTLDTWVIIKKRLPFKQHEEIGIRELGLLT